MIILFSKIKQNILDLSKDDVNPKATTGEVVVAFVSSFYFFE